MMVEADVVAWRKFVAGRQAAARTSAKSASVPSPDQALARLKGLQEFARRAEGPKAFQDESANLAFHLRWADLRRRLGA